MLNLPTPDVSNGGGSAVTVSVKSGYDCTIVAASATIETNGGEADRCRSRRSDGTSGGTTFSGLGTSSVTIDPNGGSGDAWDTNGGGIESVIGIIIKCT
ncbi:MAG: hypothetical protein WDA60_03045 [Acidimicrobiia bacterium]